MADSETSWGVYIFIFIIMLWLIAITIVLVLGYLGKVEFGPTGPTGPSNGIVGPAGPTGPTGPSSSTGTNPGPLPIVITLTSIPCQFSNGDTMQTIAGSGQPQTIKWAFNNLSNIAYSNGVFTLPAGTYMLSNPNTSNMNTTTVTYLASQNAGTYRTIAGWLYSLDNGIPPTTVNQSDLIGVTSALSINGNPTTLTIPSSTQFTVSGTRNQFSILTWHDASTNLMIGCPNGNQITQFNLTKIA